MKTLAMKSNYHHPVRDVNVYQTKDRGRGRDSARQPQTKWFRHGGVTEREARPMTRTRRAGEALTQTDRGRNGRQSEKQREAQKRVKHMETKEETKRQTENRDRTDNPGEKQNNV